MTPEERVEKLWRDGPTPWLMAQMQDQADLFSDLIAAAIRAAELAAAETEREACAKLADGTFTHDDDHYDVCDPGYCHECDRARAIADAIRARKDGES